MRGANGGRYGGRTARRRSMINRASFFALLCLAAGGSAARSQSGVSAGPPSSSLEGPASSEGTSRPSGPPGTEVTGSMAPSDLTPSILKGPIDPKTYYLGPGDLLQVKVDVRPPVAQIVRVSPEGKMLLAEGPAVPVASVSLARAESLLTVVLSEYYRAKRVELRLLELRSFGAYVVGLGAVTGVVTATPADRVSEVLRRAGGVTEKASRRGIRVLRLDGRTLVADLGLFESTGDLANNPLVEAGDRILVPPRLEEGVVAGAVNQPGPIEVLPGDSVATALALAYGMRGDALPDSAYLESFEGSPMRTTRRYLDLRAASDRRVPYRARDLLFVRPRPDWTPTRTVQLTGEVQRPGLHALPADSVRLRRVIELAGGFTPLASLRAAHVLRRAAELPPDPEFERLSKLPSAEMSKDEYEYYSLRLRTQQPILSVNFRSLFLDGDERHDVFIRPGDQIVVPRQQPYVSVAGEVVRAGSIPFEATMTVDDYIARAGGYSSRAAKGDVAVIRGFTGEWARKGQVDHPGPGDTIWVPKKGQRSLWRDALDGVGLIAQLATVYLVIDNAVSR